MNEKSLTRRDIAEAMQRKLGLSRAECLQFIDTIIDTMREGLADDGVLKVANFGTFTVREKNARAGRNPRTGEPHTISARKSLTFKASNELRQRVAGIEPDD